MALVKREDETKVNPEYDTRRTKSIVGSNFLNYFDNLVFSFRPYKYKDWDVHKRECCGRNEELSFVCKRSIIKKWQYVMWITWKDCLQNCSLPKVRDIVEWDFCHILGAECMKYKTVCNLCIFLYEICDCVAWFT